MEANANDTKVLDGITDHNSSIIGKVTINGDVRVTGKLHIQCDSQTLIIGDVFANCLQIDKGSKVVIEGKINSKIVQNNGRLEIKKSLMIDVELRLMSESSTILDLDLVLNNVNNVKIGDNALLEIKGKAIIVLRSNISIEIGSNSRLRVEKDLYSSQFNKELCEITLGTNSSLVIIGFVDLSAHLCLFMGSSLIINKYMKLHGELCLLEGSSLEVGLDMTMKGDFSTCNDSSIIVHRKLLIETIHAYIGSNNTITVGGYLLINGSIVIERSSIIRSESFSVSDSLTLETNCILMSNLYVYVNRNLLTQSNCKLIAQTLEARTGHCVFGDFNTIQANSIVFQNQIESVTIGANSQVRVKKGIDLVGGTLLLGSKVILEAQRIGVNKLIAGNESRVTVESMFLKCGGYIKEKSKLETHKDLVIKDLFTIGALSTLIVNGNLHANSDLIIQPMSELIVIGQSLLKSPPEMSRLSIYKEYKKGITTAALLST